MIFNNYKIFNNGYYLKTAIDGLYFLQEKKDSITVKSSIADKRNKKVNYKYGDK